MEDSILQDSETQMEILGSGGFPILLFIIGIIFVILIKGVIFFIVMRSKKSDEEDNVQKEIEGEQTDPTINNTPEPQILNQE